MWSEGETDISLDSALDFGQIQEWTQITWWEMKSCRKYKEAFLGISWKYQKSKMKAQNMDSFFSETTNVPPGRRS